MKKIIYIIITLLISFNQSFSQRLCGTEFKKEDETRLEIDKFNKQFNNKIKRTGTEGEISLLSTN